MNTASSTSELATTALVISRIAAEAPANGSIRFSLTKRAMFSMTTMASSTTSPVARVSPNSVRVLIEKPSTFINAKVPIRETGIVIAGISVVRHDCRNRNTTAITIPVSLIGTFALMKVLGFSINTLTLFGLTLATGLVVDDAIVVIENIARFVNEKRMEPFAGASAAMREITSAVVASSLVLLAVFIPVAFFSGTTGQLYKQFALTIACSISISLFVALTLTPTLSALLLGAHTVHRTGFYGAINRAIDASRNGYHAILPALIRWRVLVLGLFAAGLVGTYFAYQTIPTGFLPDEDVGYFYVTIQLPEGASLADTEQVTRLPEAGS